MVIVKSIDNNTIYTVQKLYLCFFLVFRQAYFGQFHFFNSFSTVHSSTNLSNIFFLHLQFSQSKYSPTSHDLSHPHLQLPGFQINPLSHSHLSINYLHSDLHLSSVQRCLLLQTLPSNLHLHLQVSCHSMCLVSLVLGIRLNTLTFKFFITSGTQIFAQRSLILL